MRGGSDDPAGTAGTQPSVRSAPERRFRQMQTAGVDFKGEPPVARNQHTDTPGPA
jgi:hypothetical protein